MEGLGTARCTKPLVLLATTATAKSWLGTLAPFDADSVPDSGALFQCDAANHGGGGGHRLGARKQRHQNSIASWWRSTFGFGGEQPRLLSSVGQHGDSPGVPGSNGSARDSKKSGQRALRSCGA
jgi:hypothetical protein